MPHPTRPRAGRAPLARAAFTAACVVFAGGSAEIPRATQPAHAVESEAQDGFVRINGVRLHYVDWGGTGEAMLFLTGLGDSAHAFDSMAVLFTDRFHVLGLTRRGQAQSDKPPAGYGTRTLAEDIKAFLDVIGIPRATLVGFSAAGAEQTRFAGTYPERVAKLVYLDSAEDYKSGHELATNPRSTEHGDFVHNQTFQRDIARAMRKFLLGE